MQIVGIPEYDHICADALDNSHMPHAINSLENCQVLCKKCHRAKTSEHDVPMISKADRLREKNSGVRRKRKYRWPKKKFGT